MRWQFQNEFDRLRRSHASCTVPVPFAVIQYHQRHFQEWKTANAYQRDQRHHERV